MRRGLDNYVWHSNGNRGVSLLFVADDEKDDEHIVMGR